MATKTKRLHLEQRQQDRSDGPMVGAEYRVYRVIRAEDTIDYSVGQILSLAEVERLCASPLYRVMIQAGK